MKKIFLTVFLLSIIAIGATAQKGKHEVTVGFGLGTTSEFVDALADVIVSGLTQNAYSSDKSYTGAFHLGYKYGITDRFAAGGTFIYENGKSDAYFDKDKIGKFSNNYYTIAAEAEYKYVRSGSFSLYGLLGAGATIYSQKYTANDNSKNESDNNAHFNFQISPIGIKLGRNIGAFAEAGFGYKGIISAGLFARF
ncbi:outer membrane beta-barrel protein [Dysgonomonas reticulitermitis]